VNGEGNQTFKYTNFLLNNNAMSFDLSQTEDVQKFRINSDYTADPGFPDSGSPTALCMQCVPRLNVPYAAEGYAVNGYIEIEFQYETEDSTGRCCFSEDGLDECANLTKTECEEKEGLWSAGITCADQPCVIEEHQCFLYPRPDQEQGWIPLGNNSYVNEEECEENCPPTDPPTPGGRTMPTTTTGPGTHLKNMLKAFGIKAKEKGCGCKSMEKKMNKGGPQWCRDHKAEILDHLAKEAKKRKLPFVRIAAEKVLNLAIRRAEKDSA
jgi:hypothetical protein